MVLNSYGQGVIRPTALVTCGALVCRVQRETAARVLNRRLRELPLSAATLGQGLKPKEVVKLALAFDRAGVPAPALYFAVLQSGLNLRSLTPEELAALLCLYTSATSAHPVAASAAAGAQTHTFERPGTPTGMQALNAHVQSRSLDQ